MEDILSPKIKALLQGSRSSIVNMTLNNEQWYAKLQLEASKKLAGELDPPFIRSKRVYESRSVELKMMSECLDTMEREIVVLSGAIDSAYTEGNQAGYRSGMAAKELELLGDRTDEREGKEFKRAMSISRAREKWHDHY